MKAALGKDLGLLSLGAILYTLTFPPFNWTGAAWLALTPLFLLLYSASAKRAFLIGFLFGILWCVGVTNWLYYTVTDSFGLSFPFNLLFMVANYAFYAGLPTSIVTLCSARLLQRGTPWLRAFGIPALWVSGEFLRANPWFGVSWGILGYSQYQHLSFIQIADVTSVYGVSFLLALGSYTAAEIVRSGQLSAISYQLLQVKTQQSKRNSQNAEREDEGWRRETGSSSTQSPHFQPRAPRGVTQSSVLSPVLESGLWTADSGLSRIPWPALSLLAICLAVTLGYGTIRLHQYTVPPDVSPLRVALVQGNIPSEQRWQPAYYASSLLKYTSVTAQGLSGSTPDLVIWPEFAVNFYLDKEQLLSLQLGQFAQMANTALLVGAPRVEETDTATHYYNSAYLFSATGQLAGVYDKMRLVPFAEYRPFTLPGVVAHSSEAPSEFTAGKNPTIFSLPHSTFGLTICYEIAFPSMARALAQKGAQVFVNISNDTWLGGAAAAVEHHFAMSVLRAVENRRPLVRNATAGISGIIDPRGYVDRLSTAPEAVIRGEAFPVHETTVYTNYGDWFSLTCLFVSAGALALSQRRREEKEAQS